MSKIAADVHKIAHPHQPSLIAEYIEVQTLSVRGALGPVTVWTTPGGFEGKHESKAAWTKVYDKKHPASWHELQELHLDRPIVLKPGERCGIYVHSALPGDEGLVYDNRRGVSIKMEGGLGGRRVRKECTSIDRRTRFHKWPRPKTKDDSSVNRSPPRRT